MILLVEALHKFIDGLSIGSAFSIDISDGISVSLAIFTEELAHGLGNEKFFLNFF